MSTEFTELMQRAWLANLEVARRGLAIYTFGNVSAFDAARGVLAIKPSGVPYDRLTSSDMVLVDVEGRVVKGNLRPSSDTKTHVALYRAFPGIGGVAHTHSTYATAWAQAASPIPIYGTTHADHLAEDVPCTEMMSRAAVDADYEAETGAQIVACFRERDPRHTPMVLVAGHAPFTWGDSPEKAVYHAVILEELAKIAAITRGIDASAQRLPEHLVQKHFARKHGRGAYYGQ